MQMEQPVAGVASRASLSEKARAMTSLFAAQAAANEAKGSLTDATVAALRDGGFFGMWVPRCFGGSEVGPVEGLKVIEALCYADGSTGWVLMASDLAMGTA